MRNSRRIKRMKRNRGKISKMNLTSLMDVFTILVFFLLVNSGSVEVLDAPKEVQLPESKVEAKPRETVVIVITSYSIHYTKLYDKQENQLIVDEFLKNNPNFQLELFINPLSNKETNGTVQILPWNGNCDATFIAKFKKQN